MFWCKCPETGFAENQYQGFCSFVLDQSLLWKVLGTKGDENL